MKDNWRNLAAAIINMAVEDRKKALKKLEKNPEDEASKNMVKDCEMFFSSAWCAFLLDYLDIRRTAFLEAVYGR